MGELVHGGPLEERVRLGLDRARTPAEGSRALPDTVAELERRRVHVAGVLGPMHGGPLRRHDRLRYQVVDGFAGLHGRVYSL